LETLILFTLASQVFTQKYSAPRKNQKVKNMHQFFTFWRAKCRLLRPATSEVLNVMRTWNKKNSSSFDSFVMGFPSE